MADVFTKAKRSEVMSRIRGRAGPLHGPNSTARQRRPTLRVKPDFVFQKLKLAIFVDGCFWHGCPRHATKPQNNRAFWRRKLAGNKSRDQRVNRTLRLAKWRVLRIWECALQQAITGKPVKQRKHEARLVRRIQRELNH